MDKQKIAWEIPLDYLDRLAQSKYVKELLIATSPQVGYLTVTIVTHEVTIPMEGHIQEDGSWQAIVTSPVTEDWGISDTLTFLATAIEE